MAKFEFGELIDTNEYITARVGGATLDDAGRLTDKDKGKFVKLAGASRYDLAVVGNEIEGELVSVSAATQDGYAIGTVMNETEFLAVTFDGLQATPGTGTLAIGDYVLVGTPVAKGTALPVGVGPKVVKATDQALAKSSPFAWRVASGSGALGTQGVIQRVS